MADYGDISTISLKLIDALAVVMDSNATREHRAIANEFLDKFKDESPVCAHCGFHLVSQKNSPVVRHYGLFLIDHCIKYQWVTMSLDQKVFVKDNIMKLLADGTFNILEEQYHIKNALAKSVVEIIKREWPQQWPGMLTEFFALSELGETQTELTLLIFLRLAEDVVTLQNVPAHRRRQIFQGLTASLVEILPFFTTILQKHVSEYFNLKQFPDEDNKFKTNIHCQVAIAVLTTLVEYLDWITLTHLVASDCILLKMFCELLGDDKLKYPAAECLWVVTSRKGKPEDRKPLLILFEENVMAAMFKAAQIVSEGSVQEQGHTFLKRLCQTFTNLGNVLCSLLGVIPGIDLPLTFPSYLEAMLSLTLHDSQVLSSYAVSLWNSLFRHEQISRNPILLSFIPRVVDALSKKLIKVGKPSRSDSLSSTFSSLDFDSDADFNSFFSKFRTDCADVLRMATSLAPQVTFDSAANWLQSQLRKPIDTNGGKFIFRIFLYDKVSNRAFLSIFEYFLKVAENSAGVKLSTLAFYEWDALNVFLESVLSRIQGTDNCKLLAPKGICLLEEMLLFRTQDPWILSASLSCISALFVFLDYAPQALSAVLDRIFSTLVFSQPGQTKSTRSRVVKNVRRHACSCLVKLCKSHPKLLVPIFNDVYSNVKQLSFDAAQLSQLEKCTLAEALILISNEFQNCQRQGDILKEIFAPISALWLQNDMIMAFSSTALFLSYVGLDMPPVEPSSDDLRGISRSQILSCLNMLMAIMKRCACPDDVDVALAGGFVVEMTESGAAIIHNPVWDLILSFLPGVFQLLRILNSLHVPEVASKISAQYAKANDMLDVDKNNVLGVTQPSVVVGDAPHTKKQLERMQNFLTGAHDQCYYILGSCCQSLGQKFYSLPSLVDSLILSMFSNICQIPDYRLRAAIRVFMKPFIRCCPPQLYPAAVIPILSTLCPNMYQRLTQKWAYLEHCALKSNGDEDNAEAQEVLEEQLHRQLTKDYLDLIVVVLQGRKCQGTSPSEMMEEDDNPSVAQVVALGELGKLIFQFQNVYPTIVLCTFSALSWNDTTVSIKASQLCLPIIKQMLSDTKFGPDEAQHVMQCIFMGLRQHGQHESNVSILLALGLQAYEILRPIYPSLVNLMYQIPGCSNKAVADFDERLLNAKPCKQNEKKKKDMFRSLVSELISKSVGEMFSRKALLKKLPALFRAPKTKPKDPVESPGFSQGICTLFKESSDKVISTT